MKKAIIGYSEKGFVDIYLVDKNGDYIGEYRRIAVNGGTTAAILANKTAAYIAVRYNMAQERAKRS